MTSINELSRTLVGKDPFAIEKLWHECYRDTYFRGGPVNMSALSGIEMALWDIKGKALGIPAYELLGGKVRDTFADGVMHIPDRPGRGITINEEALAEHPFEARDLRHYRGDLTDIRPVCMSLV